MPDFAGSAMIALLPTTVDWCKIELPHMTLVFAGDIVNLRPTAQNEMNKDALDIAMKYPKLILQVLGTSVFGGGLDDMVDVLNLRPDPQLLSMRSEVEHWNASQHSFSPHVTVGPMGSIEDPEKIPLSLTFDRVAVGWGGDLVAYALL